MKILHLTVGMISTNCYIFYDEKTMKGAVVDPGDNAKAILETAKKENVTIEYVLLTHGHFDHILAVNDIVNETNAKYVCNKNDLWLLNKNVMKDYGAVAKNFKETPIDIEAEDGTEIKVGELTARYMATPGHTPGSSVIIVEDVMFTGDTLFKRQCGRCDLEGGDYNEMLHSLKKLHDMNGDYEVLPGHDEFSTLDYERKYNPYIREAVK